MLEAMACGVPVAASPVTGPLQVVRNRENGYLDNNLEKAVISALGISGENCRNYARNYSWEASTKQFLENLFNRNDTQTTYLSDTMISNL